MIDLRPGDNRDRLRQMARNGEFVQSVVTDPPYGLVSVTKRFGGQNAAPAKHGIDGLFARQSKGFMGKLWDGSGIERDPEFWRLVYDVMLPGAYIIAFSSSRTYGYMQVAMEAAGFITHPMFGWVFNTGFPKGHDAGKAIDRTLGVEGRFTPDGEPVRRMIPGADQHATGSWIKDNGREYQPGDYDPASDAAQKWKGWKTGTQSLKPALEPVYFGQKPFSEKTGALNILRHGVGAVNVDGCRVAKQPGEKPSGWSSSGSKASENRAMSGANYAKDAKPDADARYPANLIHDGSPEALSLFSDSKGQLSRVGPEHGAKDAVHTYGDYGPRVDTPPRDDIGSSARFFNSFPHEGPVLQYPKAAKKDRAGSLHATVKPIGLMRHFIRLVTPPGGTVLDPFAGSGTTGQAALDEGMSCILLEREQEYIRDIARRFGLNPGLTNKIWQLREAL